MPVNETDPDGDGYVACSGWSDTQGDNPGILGGGDCAPSDPFTFPGAAPKEALATACMKDKDGDVTQYTATVKIASALATDALFAPATSYATGASPAGTR